MRKSSVCESASDIKKNFGIPENKNKHQAVELLLQLYAKYTTGVIAYIFLRKKGELIIIKLADLPLLSRTNQKVIKHNAENREAKSGNYR